MLLAALALVCIGLLLFRKGEPEAVATGGKSEVRPLGDRLDSFVRTGADALHSAANVGWNVMNHDAGRAGLQNIELQAQRQEDANKALEQVLDQIESRRHDLIALEQSLGQVRRKRAQAEEEARLAEEAVAKLRRNVTRLQGERQKVAKQHERAVKLHEENKKAVSREEAKRLADESFKKFAFNEYQSSLLPLDREIPDTRIEECRALQWDISQMPKHSVIICFVNEAWSALLRTIYSVINRSPAALIEEIVLVDDGSDAEWLGGKNVPRLRTYIKTTMPKTIKFKIVTSEKRLGLIRARLLGAQHAKGPVLTFLDSHVEANLGWSEPILDIIGKNHRSVVTPVIDTIDSKTMEHAKWTQRVPAVGTFSWTMDFTWKSGEIKPGNKVTDPVDSPTMAGGLFSIHKDYFEEIGTYDSEMDGWGGENLEISFRIWTCGGNLVTAPCSHVGHIFRDTHPYTIPGSSIHETFIKNSMRVAEVWMDGYKAFFYQSRGKAPLPNLGSLTARKELRTRLKCKPFKWYLDTLLPTMFIPDDKHIQKMGALRGSGGQCIDKMGQRAGGTVGVYFCHGQGGNQAFMYSTANELRSTEDLCLDSWGWTKKLPGEVHLQKCHGGKGNQEWSFKGKQIVHKRSLHCLEILSDAKGGKVLRLNVCKSGTADQEWLWDSSGRPPPAVT